MSDTHSQLKTLYEENIGLIGAGALTVFGLAAASYYMNTRPQQIVPPVDLSEQSIECKDGSRISAYKGTGGEPMHYLYPDVRTLYEAFQRGIKQSKNGPCLGARTGPNKEFEWISYQQVYDKALAFGSGLLLKGVKPGTDTFIGIYSRNMIEWTIAEQACNMFSMVTVALYDTLGTDACNFVIDQAELSTIICENPAKAQLLLDQAELLPSLKLIILIDEISEQNRQVAEKHGITLVLFSDIEELGKNNPQKLLLPKPSDLCTISYTSGTTGNPKGVMLSHANLVANLGAVLFHVKSVINVNATDCHLSYLPLAHMFERGMQMLMFTEGARIGFFSGDIKLLLDDMQTLKPTFFPTVPRLLNRVYDKVMNGVQGSFLKSKLLSWAVNNKLVEVRDLIFRRNTIWDRLIFRRLQQSLGGNVRLIISGSAPMSVPILDFIRAAFGCPVLEGYGQTEATAGIVFNVPGESTAGHCGPPLACNYVQLVDVPEMDYYAKDGKGEVCAKGPNVCLGYYKDPAKTADAIDQDGWLHTGDIGEWLPEGTLKIIDRKKNIFKLSQGEYVAAEKIENVCVRSSFVGQCFVDGRSTESCVVAVVTLDEEYMEKWVKDHKVNKPLAELATDENVKSLALKSIQSVGKSAGLKGFEQVRDIYIHPEAFTLENGLLTPSMKNKRVTLRKLFQQAIDDLYSNMKST